MPEGDCASREEEAEEREDRQHGQSPVTSSR
jgi:hypothetical protein